MLFLYSPSTLGLTSPVGGRLGQFTIDRESRIVLSSAQQQAIANHTDQGNLSTLLASPVADAFVADAFARWTSASTAADGRPFRPCARGPRRQVRKDRWQAARLEVSTGGRAGSGLRTGMVATQSQRNHQFPRRRLRTIWAACQRCTHRIFPLACRFPRAIRSARAPSRGEHRHGAPENLGGVACEGRR